MGRQNLKELIVSVPLLSKVGFLCIAQCTNIMYNIIVFSYFMQYIYLHCSNCIVCTCLYSVYICLYSVYKYCEIRCTHWVHRYRNVCTRQPNCAHRVQCAPLILNTVIYIVMFIGRTECHILNNGKTCTLYKASPLL